LLNVIGIMARHVDNQIRDRNTATLSMDAKALPLFWADLLQKLQICIAKQSEEYQRVSGDTGGIVSHSRPEILIKWRQLNARVFHHLTIASSRGNFVIGKMRKDFADGPLVFAGTSCELLIGRFGHQFCQDRRRLLLHL
jgi:hypothetical protein